MTNVPELPRPEVESVPTTEPPPPDAPHDPTLEAKVAKGAMWAVAANIIMRFASIAITAILARLLSKEDFGVFAVALAVYLVVASLAELGMASAIARSPREPEDIAPTVTSISILVSGVMSVAMALGAPWLAAALGQPGAAQPIQILSLCLFLTGVFAVPGAQLVRDFRQDRIFLATIVGFLVSNPVLIVLALNGGGADAFAWSRVVGQVATGVVFVASISHRYLPGWRRSAVASLVRFGVPLSLANLVNWSLLNADYMLLGRLVSAASIGAYMIAFNVANWSTAVMGSVLNTVVVPAFGRVSEDPPSLGRALISASRLVALLAFPIGAASLALCGPLIRTVFGNKWAEAIPVLAVLSVYGILYVFSLLFADVLVATARTVQMLIIQLAWIAVLVPAIILGVPRWGLVGVAWAHVVSIGVVSLPIYLFCVVRATGLPLRELAATVRLPLVGSAAAAAAGWLVSQLFAAPWLALLAGGLVGGVVYALIAGRALIASLPERMVARVIPQRLRLISGGVR